MRSNVVCVLTLVAAVNEESHYFLGVTLNFDLVHFSSNVEYIYIPTPILRYILYSSSSGVHLIERFLTSSRSSSKTTYTQDGHRRRLSDQRVP